jgi:D-amino-acid oxidase
LSAAKPGRVTIVGAGVVGLTVARALAERGVVANVVAAEAGLSQSSGAAGAVWFPYGTELAAQQERVNGWARATHAWLSELAAREPAAGVDAPLPTYFSSDARELPEWADALPAGNEMVWVDASDLPAPLLTHGRTRPIGAWRFPAPVVRPARHIEWLEGQLARPLERRTVTDLDQVDADVVVNCTGCGAAELASDDNVVARVGQTVVATEGELPRDCVLMDDRDEAAIFYSIARGPGGAEVVLGGYDRAEAPARRDRTTGAAVAIEPSPDVTRELLERHAAAGIVVRAPFTVKVGRRPGRKDGPRVEREGRVVHAYGHGGAGFTLAWGSAQTVADLVLW